MNKLWFAILVFAAGYLVARYYPQLGQSVGLP
jgi:hypothetical protein